VQLVLVDSGDLKAISRALRHHADGKRLRKELMVDLKAAAEPLVPRVQAAWRRAPAAKAPKTRGRRGQSDLRELLAKSTWVQARLTGKQAGVSVRTDGRRMPNQMKALPGYVEGIRRRPWRHPVYGNRDTWRNQRPFPRFYDAARPDEALARRKVNEAIDRVFDEIERARA
jgi:hypothetical protein